MIDKKELEALVEEGLSGSDCFVVDVQVKPDNVLVVEIDNKEGVDIERCETLHRFLESKLDRDVEDYELEVGSAGLGQPFKVVRQYVNHVGREVEVLTCDGRKLHGVLASADDEGFSISVKVKRKAEGEKRARWVEETLAFRYDEVKYTKYSIKF